MYFLVKKHYIAYKRWLPVLILFFMSFVVYGLSYRGEGKHWNYYVLLADAIVNGRLYLVDNPSWLSELVPVNGVYYIPYQPFPAVLLLPIVFFFGNTFSQPLASVTFGAINVSLCYLVLRTKFHQSVAFWGSMLFGFGTIHWYHAEVGSAWYMSHIIAITFIWLSIYETLTKKRLFLIGLMISAAFLSRIPTLFAAIFPIVYLHGDFFRLSRLSKYIVPLPRIKSWVLLGMGVLIGIIVSGIYNYYRFGSVTNTGYMLIPNAMSAPFFQYGLTSIYYVPGHMRELLFALPTVTDKWPYVIPSMYVMAIWVTTPAVILALFARLTLRLTLACFVTICAIALPIFIYGANGFTQFGYRYTLDFYPFLILLCALGMRGRVRLWHKGLIILSIAINAWGVIMISYLKLFTL